MLFIPYARDVRVRTVLTEGRKDRRTKQVFMQQMVVADTRLLPILIHYHFQNSNRLQLKENVVTDV